MADPEKAGHLQPTIEPEHLSPLITELRLNPLELTANDKFSWLATHALSLEHKYLREPNGLPQIRPESKIIFLTGGPKSDVTEGMDFEGHRIYSREMDFPRPKFAEIPEALGAISGWFDRIAENADQGLPSPSPALALGEVADVVYNLIHLTQIDKPFQDQYRQYIDLMAKASGLSLDELLFIAVVKYNYRLGQGGSRKDLHEEVQLTEQLLAPRSKDDTPLVRTPTQAEMKLLFHRMSEISTALTQRFDQLKQIYEWEHPPEADTATA
jgi:hypothetical protein